MRPIAELSASPHWLTANLPIRAAREHSGNAAIMAGRRPGHVAAPHRWLPCSVLGPGGPPGGTSKECSRPSAPCAAASALRPRPPRRGAAGYGPPLLRGYGPPAMRSPLRRGPPAPGSVGLGLSPPALTRRSAAVPALATPYGRLGRLRHSVLRSPSGCSGWSHGPPSAPQRAPSRPFCAEASVGPPRTAPPASCPPSSLGRLAALGGLRAPLLPPGAWSGPGGRFFRPPGPRRREQIQPGGIYLNRRTGRYQGCLTALRRQGRQGPAPPFREIHV